MKFRFREREVVIVVAAGATAYLGAKQGIVQKVPSVGGLSGPVVTMLLGLALASFVDGGGMTGDVVTGIGAGLVVTGALGL